MFSTCAIALLALQAGPGPERIACSPPLRLSSQPPGHRSAWIEDARADDDGRVHVLLRELEEGAWGLRHVRVAGPPWRIDAAAPLASAGSALDARLALDGSDAYALAIATRGRRAAVELWISRDEGATWAPSLRLDELELGVPEVAVAVLDGALLAAWTAATPRGDELRVQRSLDRGSTWLARPVGAGPDDASWSSAPAVLWEGPGRALAAAAVERNGRRVPWVARSQDGGASWSPVVAPGVSQEALLSARLARAGGTGAVVLWERERGPPCVSRALDGGGFAPAVELGARDQTGEAQRIVDVEIDRATLAVLVVGVRPAAGSRALECRSTLALSRDGGATFERRPLRAGVVDTEPRAADLLGGEPGRWTAFECAGPDGFPEVRVARAGAAYDALAPAVRPPAAGSRARMGSPRLVRVAGGAALLWHDRGEGDGATSAWLTGLSLEEGEHGGSPVSDAPPRPLPAVELPQCAPPPEAPSRGPEAPAPLAAPGPRATLDEGPIELACGALRARFEQSAGALHLVALETTGGHALALEEGSGGWWLAFRARGAPGTEIRVVPSDPGVRLAWTEHDGTTLRARWEGVAALAGRSIAFAAEATWRATEEPALETRLAVDLEAPADVYLAEVVHPRVHVGSIDPGHERLLLPAHGGVLVLDPLSDAGDLARFAGPGPWLNVPLIAYYGERSRTCLVYGESNPDDVWVVHNAARRAEPPGLELRSRHLPEDVFATRRFRTSASVRLELLKGDWIVVAEHERRRRARTDPDYRGPAGSPEHRASAALRAVRYTWTYPSRVHLDALDGLPRELAVLTAAWDERAFVRLYGGHWPDGMGRVYDRGYLPGVPTLRAAVREAQDMGALVAPLVPSSTAFDPRGFEGADPARAARHAAILAAAVRREDGGFLEPVSTNLVMCNGAPWWRETLVGTASDVLERTGARGLYLDYFLAAPCFSEDHAHAPGGGAYPWRNRAEDLRRIRSAARARGADVAFALEAPQSRVAGLVDLVHVFPRTDVFGLEPALSIPFFRWVHDDVRVSRHPSLRFGPEPEDARSAGWTLATEVLTYGQLPVRPSTDAREAADLFLPGWRERRAYFRSFVELLGEERLLPFHQGALVRPPELVVHGADGLDPPRSARGERTAAGYFDGPLVQTLLRAWDGRFAYVITNPWLGSGRTVGFRASIDPARVEGFPAVHAHGPLGDTRRTESRGPLELAGELAPGEIRSWTIEPR